MNCKQGDLAVIVKSKSGNEGKIVTCLGPYNGPWQGADFLPGWVVDRELSRCDAPYTQRVIADSQLRPIRDNPGNESWYKAAPLTVKPKQSEAV